MCWLLSMVLGPWMDGGETLFVVLLPLQCAVRLLEYQCKSLHPTISLDYKWLLHYKGEAVLRVGTMQTLLVLCYCLFSSPFLDGGNRRNFSYHSIWNHGVLFSQSFSSRGPWRCQIADCSVLDVHGHSFPLTSPLKKAKIPNVLV